MMLLHVLVLLIANRLQGAESLTLSTHTISFQAVSSGLAPGNSRTVHITPGGGWTAKLGIGPRGMLSIDKSPGADALIVSVPTWWIVAQEPGAYNQEVVIIPIDAESGPDQRIQVSVSILAAAAAPAFTYLAGPNGCSAVPGVPDFPVCDVPGERPSGTFEPPRKGASYTDFNFGGTAMILTDPEMYHGYSSPSAISPGNRFVLVGNHKGSATSIVDLATGSAVAAATQVPGEGAIWDVRDDNVMYSLGGSGRPAAIIRYDLRANERSVAADLSSSPHHLTSITSGATGEGSKDNWLPFYAPREQHICAYSVDDDRVYCADLGALPGGPYRVDFPTMARGIDRTSRKRYVVAVGSPALLVFSVNEGAGTLELETRGPERIGFGRGNGDGICDVHEDCVRGSHADLFEDAAGEQYILVAEEYQNPCEYSLVSYRLNAGSKMSLPIELGGGLRRIMPLFRCGGRDRWVDLHIGCARAAPFCVVSTGYLGFNQALEPGDLTARVDRTPFLSEIFVVGNNGTEIRRLAQHRSIPFRNEVSQGYWSTPRACISSDGAYVIYDSNFGFPNQPRVVQIATGYGSPR